MLIGKSYREMMKHSSDGGAYFLKMALTWRKRFRYEKPKAPTPAGKKQKFLSHVVSKNCIHGEELWPGFDHKGKNSLIRQIFALI